MGDGSKIEWTDATWNPVTGCTKVSPGCDLLGPVELEWSWLWCDHDSASGTGDPRVWKCDSCVYTWREVEVEDAERGTYWVTNVLTNRTFKARKETVRPEAFIDWVIVGGESGAGARPMQPYWAYTLRDQCEETDTAFFFKQWGSHDEHGKRMSKHAAGRELGGRTWNEYPSGSYAELASVGEGSL